MESINYIYILAILPLLALVMGLVIMSREGNKYRYLSNKLMKARIWFQAIVIIGVIFIYMLYHK